MSGNPNHDQIGRFSSGGGGTKLNALIAKHSHPVFGAYSFDKPIYAAVTKSGKVLAWSTSKKTVEGKMDRQSNNREFEGAVIHKVTKESAGAYK